MSLRRETKILGWVAASSLALGFVLTFHGSANWDSWIHWRRSEWLVSCYHLPSSVATDEAPNELDRWYGPLWQLVLGIFSGVVFPFLRDPNWVRSAVNFALYPLTLFCAYRLLRRARAGQATAFLASSLVLAQIRLGGHAFTNTNDAPLACFFLLATLWLWLKLFGPERARVGAGANPDSYPLSTLLLAGAVAVIPYLLRPPMLLLLGAVSASVFWQEWRARRSSLNAAAPRAGNACAYALGRALVPLASAFVTILATFPAIWDFGFRAWAQSFLLFSKYPHVDEVRVLGQSFTGDHLPLWYPFAWFLVSLSPLALFSIIASPVVWLCFRAKKAALPATAPGPNLATWMGVITLALWLGILVARPNLYDEDRHLLFLFPPVLVLAALLLDTLHAKTKFALAALLSLLSLFSYAQWGRYSYIYESPLIARGASNFMGDYWGLCVGPAFRDLVGIAPTGSYVQIQGPITVAWIESERLGRSLLAHVAGFGGYRVSYDPAKNEPYYVIAYNRNGQNRRILDDIRAGRAEALRTYLMPTGDVACVSARYR